MASDRPDRNNLSVYGRHDGDDSEGPSEEYLNNTALTPARISFTPAPLHNPPPIGWDISSLSTPCYSCDACGKSFDNLITKNRHQGQCRRRNQSQTQSHRTFERAVKALPECSQNVSHVISSSEDDFIFLQEDSTCKTCSKEVTCNEHALWCECCKRWLHQRCMGMSPIQYEDLRTSEESWFCNTCHQQNRSQVTQPVQLQQLQEDIPQPTTACQPPLNNDTQSLESMSSTVPSETHNNAPMTPPAPSVVYQIKPNLPDILFNATLSAEDTTKVWTNIPYNEFLGTINSIYNEIVLYRRNLFKLPSGKVGKDFINELTFWLHQFNSSSKLNAVALEIFMILPTIMLQKPSARSKAKEHSLALGRRLKLWKAGDIEQLMREIRHIQKSFTSSKKKRSPDDIARSFSKLIMEGKVSAALKLLDKESSTGVLNLTEEVLKDLKMKHPEPAPISENTLLHGPVDKILECYFDGIDEQTVLRAALNTKGSAGPSGMDAELYRRILCSKNFSTAGKALREQIALLARNLATKSYHPRLIGAFVASRLIPLDKNPGTRPIGIGEVLRRIVGKMISRHSINEIKEAAGPLQTCAGHGAGAEAAIHAMRQVFENDETDAVLLIDASNAFNCLNRSVALHNIQITCPKIANYLINTYRHPSRLFIAGGKEIPSQEGTTQGDPLAMPWYSLSTVPMINHLQTELDNIKQVWLADDAAAAGKIEELHEWYLCLENIGKQHGYYVNRTKSWLIVKSSEAAERAKILFGDSVNITTEGKRHLGAVIGSAEYKKEYCEEKVNNWVKELTTLCEIAETQPQSAYAAFTQGYRSKFTYFLRTIENFEQFVEPVETLLTEKFIPALFGSEAPQNVPREVLSLNPSEGGLGITILAKEAE